MLTSFYDHKLSGTWLHRFLDKLNAFCAHIFFWVLEKCGAVKYITDYKKAKFIRGRVLWEEAANRGIEMKSVILFGKEIDTYKARIHGKNIFFDSVPRPFLPKGSGLWWLDDKERLRSKLEEAGLPVPRGGSSWREGRIVDWFHEIEKPVIIKPRLGSRGRHTTTFIHTEEQVREGFRIAKQICPYVMIGEHIKGSVYRGTVIDGKLVGVLGGSPPRITGDGSQTVAQLVEIKNKNKPEGVSDVMITPAHIGFLGRQGYTLDTVLPRDVTIDVIEKIGVSYGGSSFECTDETHDDIKRVMEQAAAVVKDLLVGFDFIIEDITRAPAEQKWGIIECNSLPFLNLHHYPLIGKPNNVSKYVWDMWDEYLLRKA